MKTWILREMVICCCSTALQLQSFFREINFLILALIEHFSVKLHSCCAICTTRYLPFSFFFFYVKSISEVAWKAQCKKKFFLIWKIIRENGINSLVTSLVETLIWRKECLLFSKNEDLQSISHINVRVSYVCMYFI